MNIRSVQPEDIKEICRIYNYYVENTAVTFETVAVTEEEMQRRVEGILQSEFPYYVAEVDGKVIGFAYIHLWHIRKAYSSTKEVTIYLDHQVKGKGYGTQLFQYLLDNIDYNQTHALIAAVCIPNDASVKLHEKFGFQQASHFKEVGTKFNKWWDVGHWMLIPDNA